MSQRCWLGVLLLAGATAVPAQAQVTLEWKLKTGDKFFLEKVVTSKEAVKFAGQDVLTEKEETARDSFKVTQANDDAIVLERKIESAKIKAQGPGAEILDKLSEKKVGCLFTVSVNPRQRKVTKVEGVEAFLQKTFGDNPQLRQMLGGALNEAVFAAEMEDLLTAYLPERPVKQGDKWKHKSTVPLGPLGSLAAENEYTYAGKKSVDGKELDLIERTSTMKYVAPKKGGALGLQVSKGDLRIDGAKGSVLFDAARGRLVQMDGRFTGKGTLSVSAMGQDFDLELELEQSLKARAVEKGD